jgi:N-acetylmuramoyl-L-alanine amidase
MFDIQSQRLTGASDNGQAVAHEPSPNVSAHPILPKFLVFHYTACSFDAARRAFLNAQSSNRVSAHLLVDEDGSVTQFVDFDRRAWHAGTSFWKGFTDLNTHSIGIEVVNFGYLQKHADGTFHTGDGKQPIAADRVVEAMHKNPDDRHRFWHAYTAEQVETCAQLAQLLVSRLALQEILGHDDIAPDRKVDPGPAFPMHRIASRAFDRADNGGEPQPLFVSAQKLNLRMGPGVQHSLVRDALVINTKVVPRQPPTNGWMQVEAEVPAPNVGWVSTAYLRASPVG